MNLLVNPLPGNLMKAWLIIFGLLLSTAVYGQEQKAGAHTTPLPERSESRLEMILEFDYLVAEFLDALLKQERPDPALLEWCEKAETRAMAYPKMQQAFGEIYITLRACIKGETRKARLAFQHALWLMAGERSQVLNAGAESELPAKVTAKPSPAP